MSDGSEKFRNLPAIRSRLADPMKTSREMDDLIDNFKKSPDNSQMLQEMNSLRISQGDLSNIVSSSIINNQRDYNDLSYTIDNLADTYRDIGRDIQNSIEEAMYDQMVELKRLRQQEAMKIRMQQQRMAMVKKNAKHLENIDEGTEDTNRELRETNMTLNNTNSNLKSIEESLNSEFRLTQNYLADIKASSDRTGEVSYGASIPKKKNIVEIMENADFASKATLLALYSNNMLNVSNPLYQTFSSYFIDYVKNNDDPQTVREICQKKNDRIETMTKEFEDLENPLKKAEKAYKESHKEYEEYNNSEKMDEKVKKQKYEDMIKTYEEMKEIEDQRDALSNNIGKEKIGLISEEEIDLLDVYQHTKGTDNVIDLMNMGVLDDATLERLLRNQSVDGDTTLEIARIMIVGEDGVTPKIDLDGDVGRRQQLKAQTIQGNIALKQRGMMLEHVKNIGSHIQETNQGIKEANHNLENINQSIDEGFERSNEFLDSILQTNEITNTLIEESNYFLAEGNELTKISNHILTGIYDQIGKTGSQLTEVLENIGNTIIIGFNETLQKLDDIQRVNERIESLDEGILEELIRQSEILSSIDKKLSNPLEIKANEYFRYGMEILSIASHPTKEDRKAGLESFENGLKHKNTHILNLYGAGTAYKNLNEDKRAAMYMERAYKLANKEHNSLLANSIAMDLAKIYTKYLKIKVAKKRIDEAITHNQDDIEAFLLRARLCNILNQKEEFKKTLTIIYHKIVDEGKQANIKGNYQDMLKYLFKPAKDYIDQQIQRGVIGKLMQILPSLKTIGHKDAITTIIEHILFIYPQDMIKADIGIKDIVYQNKDHFSGLYKAYSKKQFKAGRSEDFFALAYIGYKAIDFNILERLITNGLEFDIDFIKLKMTTETSARERYKANIQRKIYTLGTDAKYMVRDYLKNHPNSPLLG